MRTAKQKIIKWHAINWKDKATYPPRDVPVLCVDKFKKMQVCVLGPSCEFEVVQNHADAFLLSGRCAYGVAGANDKPLDPHGFQLLFDDVVAWMNLPQPPLLILDNGEQSEVVGRTYDILEQLEPHIRRVLSEAVAEIEA